MKTLIQSISMQFLDVLTGCIQTCLISYLILVKCHVSQLNGMLEGHIERLLCNYISLSFFWGGGGGVLVSTFSLKSNLGNRVKNVSVMVFHQNFCIFVELIIVNYSFKKE